MFRRLFHHPVPAHTRCAACVACLEFGHDLDCPEARH